MQKRGVDLAAQPGAQLAWGIIQKGTRMRRTLRPFQALLVILAVTAAPRAGWAAPRPDEPAAGFEGTWKLVVLAFGQDEFVIIKVNRREGGTSATVVAAQRMVVGNASDLKIDPITIDGDAIRFTLRTQAGPFQFLGSMASTGPDAGRILGTFTFRGDVYPARLERTQSNKVADLKPSSLSQEYVSAARERDLSSKLQKLRDAIKKHQGSPTNYLFYGELVASAEAAGLPAPQVGELTHTWLKEAAPYGGAWLNEVRQKALKSLGAAKPYAGLALELAEQADKELNQESELEQKAAVVAILARSAKLAGKTDLAAEAEVRSAKLEQLLDDEYHRKVPPFKPEKFAGRKKPEVDRVVLMEIFTGAQCPPCVAADVGFDGLLATYKPTEFIGLQYHLHIPGPDPLTNEDTEARQKYYESDFQGTPSTFFNGQSQAGGGGAMEGSQEKYREFREIVDRELEKTREANIDLSATRAADQIEIKARASVTKKTGSSGTAKENGESAGSKGGGSNSKPRLRLALVEESIRYVGTNRLRFHQNVVRALPGGPAGRDLASGSGEVSIKVNLKDLRRGIEEYLSERAKTRPFPGVLPEIALDHLSVVAFVQDDSDKRVLDAAWVPVKAENP
jgi:hypothetical protein